MNDENFQTKVLNVVRAIPEGSVASYGQVAAYVGQPNGARDVGSVLNSLGKASEVPWWRVLNNAGEITLVEETSGATPEQQQELLAKEGIAFDAPRKLDMDRYRYRPDEAALRSFGLAESIAQELIRKYAPVIPPQATLSL